MNLVDIKEQALSALRLNELKEIAARFEIFPVGDLRVKQTWIDAIKLAIQTAKESVKKLAKEAAKVAVDQVQKHVTYDNAVMVANRVVVWNDRAGEMLQRFTVSLPKILWSACLVAIALATLAIDLWKEREQAKYDAWTLYHKARLEVKEFFRHQAEKVESASRKIDFEYRFLRFHGDTIFRTNVVRPVMAHRDRINAMAKAAKI